MRTLVVLLLLASSAQADERAEQEARTAPHLAVSGTLGVATPLGWTGVELEAHLARWLSLSAGAGLGSSGPQLATMARVGIPLAESKPYLGVGLSGGRYEWHEFVFDDEAADKTWSVAYWANAEIGHEWHWGHTAWGSRAFVGWSGMLNRNSFECNNDHCLMDHADDGEWMFYTGFAITRSFQ